MNNYFHISFKTFSSNLYFFKNNLFFDLKNNLFFLNFQKDPSIYKISDLFFNKIATFKYISSKKKTKKKKKINTKSLNKSIFFYHKFFYSFKIKMSFLKNILRKLYYQSNLSQIKLKINLIYKKTFGEGFLYIRGLFIIFFIDACFTDEEPLWEPIE